MLKIKLQCSCPHTLAATHTVESAKQYCHFNDVTLNKLKIMLHLLGIQGSGVVFLDLVQGNYAIGVYINHLPIDSVV